MQWGPLLLLLPGIVFGVLHNNRSISHLDTRIGDLIRSSDARHNDLKDFVRSEVKRLEDLIKSEFKRLEHLIKSETKRLEDRIDRVERPVVRPSFRAQISPAPAGQRRVAVGQRR